MTFIRATEETHNHVETETSLQLNIRTGIIKQPLTVHFPQCFDIMVQVGYITDYISDQFQFYRVS